MPEARRKLAAILAADVVGYSRLMGADEQATLTALNDCRSVFRERIHSHGGRVVDTSGDAILAVFDSVVESAKCAIEIQRELAARNEPLADDRRMRFRIGINLGDVIEQDDGTLYGDGVNIAARLEAIAAPGGISVSGPAHDFIEGRVEAPMRFLGEHRLKNIAGPVRAFELDWRPSEKTGSAADRSDPSAMHSIAVLPFSSISGDEDAGYFADALTEEILDSLSQGEYHRLYSRWPLKVASRSASRQFALGAEATSLVAQRLGVHYVLEGSVRRMGGSLRITVQLIRAEGGFHVWSKSYRRQVTEGFEVETRLAQNIAHLATSELMFDAWKRRACELEAFRDIEPTALQHFVDAEYQYRLIRLGEGGDWTLYEQLLKRAIEADAAFATAHSLLAFTYMKRLGGRLSLAEAAGAAHAAIDKALALTPEAFQTLWQLGEIQLNLDLDYARAEATFRRVLNKAPSNIWMHYNLATIALREGRAREATRLLTTASALDAGYEQAGFLNSYAWLLNVIGDYPQSLKVCAKGLGLAMGGPERAGILLNQSLALACLDRAAETEPLIEEAWELAGHEKPERYVFVFARLGDSERARRILDAARGDSGADEYGRAIGALALGDVDAAFEAVEAAIEDHDALIFDSLRTAGWWRALRDDPRYGQMVDLLESKETHTENSLREHRTRPRA